MKKLIAMLLAALMVLSLAACTANETTESTGENTVDTTPAQTEPVDTEALETEPVETEPMGTDVVAPADNDASAVLNTIWGLYGEDQKFFAMGGDYNFPVDGAAGPVDLSSVDFLTVSLIVPEAEVANIVEAGSLMHAMNANTFTAGAYKLAEGVDAAAFVATMQTAIKSNQWMCGFPELLLIANVDGVIVIAFGHSDAINPFQTNLTTAYANAEILVNEAIEG